MNSLHAEPGPHDGDQLTLREHPVGGAKSARETHARAVDDPEPGRPGVWFLTLAVLGAAAGAAYVFVNRQGSEPVVPAASTPAPNAVPALPPPARPFGGDVTPIDLPPLGQSDPAVRSLVNALSSHPRVVAWLATSGLIRNFTLVVSNIAEGKTPARHLQTLGLASPFRVTDSPIGLVGDVRNDRRYDALAAAVASIDPAGAARLYGSIKPSIEEAYRELGQDMPFDRTLERAIVVLLETPAPEPSARLTRAPKGIGYRFADQRTEALSGAQKQLLRAGPDNVQIVQSWLRTVAAALGIPAERLPARRG
jgi:hypothetical protein